MPTNTLNVDRDLRPFLHARGPLSQWVIDSLGGVCGAMPHTSKYDAFGDDAQLALYLSYEPHFGGLAQFPDAEEWDPRRIAFRQTLEAAFERALRLAITPVRDNGTVTEVLRSIVASDRSPSLSRHIESHGTVDELRDIVMHRSAYQRKEGDAHTFAIPRLDGRAKQLLVGIQAGEYGADGAGRRTHAQLFASTMEHLGLCSTPNHYINELPGSAFAISNLVSMFGLNRRWRGALVGHLAIFEMTSVEPMQRYANGVERLGLSVDAGRFYRVHTLADIEHETMALDMAEETIAADPALRADVVFGAQCVIEAERRFANSLFAGWSHTATLDDAALHAFLDAEPWVARR